MVETWRDVPGHPKYIVSSEGRVAKIMKGSQWVQGGERYRRHHLSTTKKSVGTHRIVALAFLGRRPEGMVVNHKNGITTDNRAENLEYVTPSQNRKHAYEVLGDEAVHGEDHHNSKLTDDTVREMRRLYQTGEYSQRKLAEMFGIARSTVEGIVCGKWWKHIK